MDIIVIFELGTPLGFDHLCWHNFRIIETNLSGISIEHNSRIIAPQVTYLKVWLIYTTY